MAETTSLETVLFERDNRVGRIILNRPERLNALNDALRRDVAEALDLAEADPDIRVVILKGAGRAFCSGGDWSGGAGVGRPRDVAESQKRSRDGMLKWHLKIWDFTKPLIAQVHGYCLGGATEIPILCDITMVAEDARVGWPTIPNGGASISPVWFWLVGPHRAKEGSFALRQLTGREAFEWGWANHVYPADRLEEETEKMARDIARIPSEILRMKKIAINRISEMLGFRTALSFGAEFGSILHYSHDVENIEKKMRDLGWQEFQKVFQAEGV